MNRIPLLPCCIMVTTIHRLNNPKEFFSHAVF